MPWTHNTARASALGQITPRAAREWCLGRKDLHGEWCKGGGQASSGQPTNRKGHGRVPSYWDKGPARGDWGCRRSSGREVSGGTAPRTWRAPWRCSLWCRHPWAHTGTCDWRGREGASTQRRLGLTQEGDGASKRWPCQWSGDIHTGRVTKHRPQLAVSGDGERGGVSCPVVLCSRDSLPDRPRGGPVEGGEGKAAASSTGRVGAPIGQPATPAAPAAAHGRGTPDRASPSAAAAAAGGPAPPQRPPAPEAAGAPPRRLHVSPGAAGSFPRRRRLQGTVPSRTARCQRCRPRHAGS